MNPNGNSWDFGLPDFLPPDPWVNIAHGFDTPCTSVAPNTYTPVWNQTCDVVLTAGIPLVIEYVDEDIAIDDVLGTVTLATDADIVGYVRQTGQFVITGPVGSLTTAVYPTP